MQLELVLDFSIRTLNFIKNCLPTFSVMCVGLVGQVENHHFSTRTAVLRLLLLFIDLHSLVIRFSFEQEDYSIFVTGKSGKFSFYCRNVRIK